MGERALGADAAPDALLHAVDKELGRVARRRERGEEPADGAAGDVLVGSAAEPDAAVLGGRGHGRPQSQNGVSRSARSISSTMWVLSFLVIPGSPNIDTMRSVS